MKISIKFFFIISLLPLIAYGREKKVLLIETMSVPIVTTHSKIISETLKRLDPSIKLSVFNGNGQSRLIEKHLSEQIDCDCFDVLVTNATLASKIGKKMLTKKPKPMVFVTVADPVGAGLAQSINQPTGGFITGRVQSVKRGAKIEIANKLLKGNKTRVGLVATTYPSAVTDIEKIESILGSYKNFSIIKRIIKYSDKNQSKLDNMYRSAIKLAESIHSEVDFFWAVNGPLSERGDFVSKIKEIKPVLYGANVKSVKQGALFTVIPDPIATGEEVAKIIIDILNGKDPGSILVKPATKNVLAFNLKTSKQLKIIIPSSLLQIAGKNVFHE